MKIKLSGYIFNIRLIPLTVTLVAFAILFRLGYWQTTRAEEKVERKAHIEQLQKQGVIELFQLASFIEKYDPTGLLVSVTGQFIPEKAWLLDNQIVKGKPGYDVLVAFQPSDEKTHLLVNLGWIQGDYGNRQVLPEVSIPEGEFSLELMVKSEDKQTITLSNVQESDRRWPKRIQQVDFDWLKASHGQSFMPVTFLLNSDSGIKQASTDQSLLLSKYIYHYNPVVMEPEKHRGYAMQWFLLAASVLIIFIVASREKQHQETP